MTPIELLDIISTPETSTVQFKAEMPHKDDFAKELIAMTNSLGGVILLGVQDKTGKLLGLSNEQIHQYGPDIANIATDKVVAPVYVATEIVAVGNNPVQKVLVVHVRQGSNKPYKDRSGNIYVKQSDTTRRVTDNSEILRLFQESSNLSADEMEIYETSIDDIDREMFESYFQRDFGMSIEDKGFTFERALKAKRILRNDKLTLAGLLFFGKDPQIYRTAFCIRAVSFFGNDIVGNRYRDSRDISGTIPQLFADGMHFLITNLRQVQAGQNFNSIGVLEISRIALEEILQNALLHRDYFKNASIRLLVFDDRVQIISPGKLPNSLTVEDIKYGNPVIRNNQLVYFGSRLMPYRGLGSGVSRALEEQPNIDLVNDVEGEQFIVTIPRPLDVPLPTGSS